MDTGQGGKEVAMSELQEQWTCCEYESPGATIKEPVAGPRQGPGRKQAEGFSRWREGHRILEGVRKGGGVSLGHCPGPKARVLGELRERPAGAREESGVYLKRGEGAPGSRASESSPHQ